MKPKISDYLSLAKIRLIHHAATPLQVFEELVGALSLENQGTILKDILLREQIGSTVIAPGIALPHARGRDLKDIVSVLGICRDGVKMNPNEDPIHIFLLFVSPTSALNPHLKFLASASSLFQTHGFARILMEFTTAEAILEKIKEIESRPHAQYSAK